jgi:cytochrome c oxidase subunit II
MRILATLLFLALLVFGVWTFADASNHAWWLPESVSTFGPEIDRLFYMILFMVGFFFVLTEAILVACVFVYSKKRPSKATFTHGNHRLEMIWTAVPAVLLLFIAFSQMGTWAEIKFKGNRPKGPPLAEVYASQFDWRFRYPGKDGEFGTMDDLENPFEFVVPAGEPVLFNLKTRDVIHSFFVPAFRLKQDATPGMTIPVWFNAQKEGTYDLICAELCGWGHYKMAGRVRVVSRAEFERFLAELQKDMDSTGTEG